MRIKLNNYIDMCKRVSYNEGSRLLHATTYYNTIIVIDCRTESKAKESYEKLLIEGYFDASFLEYTED